MTIIDYLAPALGGWPGSNGMRLRPTDDYERSAASAEVQIAARNFIAIDYTWSTEGQAQDGLLLISDAPEPAAAKAVWADSWHSSESWLEFRGGLADGQLVLEASYPAPPGPDWGWQIRIDPGTGDGPRITMHNLMPGHPAYQVVELALER